MSLLPGVAFRQQCPRLSVFSHGVFVLVVGVLWTHGALAGVGRYPWEDFDKRLEASQSVGALSSDLFGDRVGLQNGSLSFEVTDVSIPGNSSLPVAFTRRYEVINHKDHNGADGMLGDWNVVVPNISGSFAKDWESNGSIPGNRCSDRQPPPLPHGEVSWNEFWHGIHIEIPGVGGGELLAYDATVNPKTVVPSDGAAYKWVTNDHIRVYCLPEGAQESLGDNHTGENFVAVAPDGTTYWFTHMAQYFEPTLETLFIKDDQTFIEPHARRKNVLYATKVQDRFGNWVTYTYAATPFDVPARLEKIESSDGRSLTISYLNGVVSTVSGAGRTWDYSYVTTSGGRKSLDRVTLPDGSDWTYDFEVLTDAEIEAWEWGESDRSCTRLETPPNYNFEPVGTVTHPSGAVGTFTLFIQEHGRSNVPVSCGHVTAPYNNPGDDINTAVISSNSFTLKQKRIHGPGLTEAIWNYSYPGGRKSIFFPDSEANMQNPICNDGAACHRPKSSCAPACPGSIATVVTGPNQEWARYTYGNSYLYNEGKLLSVERGKIDAAGVVTVLETTVNTYDFTQVDQSYLGTSAQQEQIYPASYGDSLQPNFDGFSSEFHRPQVAAVTTRQGVSFVWEANDDCGATSSLFCFDVFAAPTDVNKFSTLPDSPVRNEVTTYHLDPDDWIVGQVGKLTVNGIEVSETTYDANGLPLTQESFGKRQHTLGYDLASGVSTGQRGTLKTYKDGRNNVTTVTNWHRGVPTSIAYPDGSLVQAEVNPDGTIASVTNEVGAKTCYSYEDGRLSQITYPSETEPNLCDGSDSAAWHPTRFDFSPSSTSAYGVAAGHWRQTIQTGNGVKVSYFDAMWRPVLTREYEVGSESSTERFSRFKYDHAGRTTFAAYPSTSSAATKGIETFYDALGRVTQVEQDAELDLNGDGVVTEADELNTITEYLAGFKTRVTNPRIYSTTTSYLAFDQPSTDWPVLIQHPLGVVTGITRDVFGKPTAITRESADATQSVTRTYGYNAAQELCRTAEPETGVTIMHYDAAGNVDWSASGQAPTVNCADALPASIKVLRGYDERNRLTSLTFPDDTIDGSHPRGNGSQEWVYTPDGLPETVTTVNYENGQETTAVNAYTYKQRRLPATETLSQSDPGYAWSITYSYTRDGHLASHTYPGGLSVAYAPNALGQPTQAGSYATGVDYFPNGAVAQFTYGNGIVHQMTPNARQLPMRSLATYGGTEFLDDYYDYDANGNVAAISDGRTLDQRGNRTMTYDALDRLKTATSLMFGGVASYDYDALDNLTHVVAPGRDHEYKYIDDTNRLTGVVDTGTGATVIGLDYDDQGNLSVKNGVDHDFDLGNRLREVEGKERYRYDSHGRRIQATDIVTNERIFSFYGQDGVLRYQRNRRKDESVQYVYLAGSLVAEVVDAPVVPTAPVLSATPLSTHTGEYAVLWNATNASHYQLEESSDAGSTWTVVARGPATGWNATGKAIDSYEYRVRACDVDCSVYSNVVKVTVVPFVPDVPVLTVPTYGLHGDYTVSWTSETGSTHYELMEGAVATGQGLALSKSFVDKASGTYTYKVRACNDEHCSAWSASDSVQVVYPPDVPEITVPTYGFEGDYTVSWTSESGATRYELMEGAAVTNEGLALGKSWVDRPTGTYTYQVHACNQAGCSAWSASDSVQVVYKPDTPVLSVPDEEVDGSFTVNWTSEAGATGYELQENAVKIYDGAALSKSWTDHAAGTYDYRVRACNVAGCSAYTPEQTLLLAAPSAGSTLSVSGSPTIGDYTINGTLVTRGYSYRLHESVNGAAWVWVHTQNWGLSKAFSKPGGTYAYRAWVCNAFGCGPYGATVTLTVKPVTAPTLTVPTSDADGDYTISWTAVSGATSYRVQEFYELDDAWVTLPATSATSKAFADKPAGDYQYKVYGCNSAGCGPTSSVKVLTVLPPPPPPSTPTGLYVEKLLFTNCAISWNAVANATSYQVQNASGIRYSGSSTSYRETGCSGSYQVRACNASSCSAWSAGVYPRDPQ